MKVSVYFNLHRKVFSVRADEGPSKGKVIGYAKGVIVDNVTLKVNRAGQARVRTTGHKNIHAFVRGEISAAFDFQPTQAGRDGMLPWFLNRRHTIVGSDVYRAHCLRADMLTEVGKPFFYDPYTCDEFQLEDGTPIFGAETAHLWSGYPPVARNPTSERII